MIPETSCYSSLRSFSNATVDPSSELRSPATVLRSCFGGLIRERGVLAPECIDPQPFLELMTQHEMPWHVIDLPPAD